MARTTHWAKELRRRVYRLLVSSARARRLPPEAAYRLWSETYDNDADNVVLAIEEEVFASLLSEVRVEGRVLADVGCGTGRHWSALLARRPDRLHGVDTSPEMLARLRVRHPNATLHWRVGTTMGHFGDGTVDLLVSAMMLGYAPDIEAELREWTRVIKKGGEIIATDFHPEALRAGMKRTFTHDGKTFEIEHRHYGLDGLRAMVRSLRLELVSLHEKTITSSIRSAFPNESQARASRKAANTPLVLGFRLRKVE